MLRLAGGIVERGYAVDLVLARAEGSLLNEVPSRVQVVDLGAGRDLYSLLPLARYLRREVPTVLLSGLHTNLIAIVAGRLAGVPTRIVVSERTTLSSRVGHYASDLRMRIMPSMVRRLYPWADSVVAVSVGVADDLVHEFGLAKECVRVIYNPIVTADLRAKMQSSLDHPWFKLGEKPVVLAVGRLTPAKDFSHLITAFARVCKVHAARLLILGEGEERALLEELIRDLELEGQVSMPGFVANPYPYMAHASLFVLSSRWEGLPGVLIEAMYCGIPLIATDCLSGPNEILAGGKYGRLVPVGDVSSLAQAITDGLEGRIPCPPEEGWRPFEMKFILDQYIAVLFGDPDGKCGSTAVQDGDSLPS